MIRYQSFHGRGKHLVHTEATVLKEERLVVRTEMERHTAYETERHLRGVRLRLPHAFIPIYTI